jgi:hypothetical protein
MNFFQTFIVKKHISHRGIECLLKFICWHMKTVNGYKIGTTVRVISGLLSRYQIEKIHGHELTILDVPDNTEIRVRKAVQLLSTTIYPWNRYYNVIINFQVH